MENPKDDTRWQRIDSLFQQALELPEPGREAFLQSECHDDPAMLGELLAMLHADRAGDTFLEGGLPRIASHIIGNSDEAFPNRQIGPYRLIRVLGEGGMGIVWLAEREDTEARVALKFLLSAALSPARRERFAREIKTLAKLKHPFIARLYDAGTLDDGTPWFAMEFVEGIPLTDYLQRQPQSIADILQLFRKVCEAVQYAHSQVIVHRDLKPSNILVEDNATPRVVDFGIARELQTDDDLAEQTRPALRFYSPHYAAPEWVRDGEVGFYTDVYSLGVILYQMLTGQLPRKRKADETASTGFRLARPSTIAANNAALHATPGRALLSRGEWNDLDVLCLKALHQHPKDRYPSVEALLRDLNHYLASEPLEAQPDTLRYRVSKFVVRNRRPVIATTLGVAALIALIVFVTVRVTTARTAALAEAARTQRIQQFMLKLFTAGDNDAGPSNDLRVVTLVDRGVEQANALSNDPSVKAELNRTLGTIYEQLGKFDRADPLLQAALQGHRSLPGPDQSQVAQDLIALGLLRSEQGHHKDGEPLIREAISILERQRPVDDAALAKADFALGAVLTEEGNYQQAVVLLEHALQLQSKKSESSTELSDTLNALADAHVYLGHYDVADQLSRRALAIDQKIYGVNHPSVADDLINVSQVEEQWGHYADAEAHERQALAITESWRGPDHPDTAGKMVHLATTLAIEGKNDEAAGLLQKATTVEERVYGNANTHVAYLFNTLGSVEFWQGKAAAAEADHRRAIAIYTAALGPADYRVGVVIANLASDYLETKQYAQAEPLFRQSLAIYEKALPPGTIDVGIAEVKLGRTILYQHRIEEAEPHTLVGYQILIKQTDPSTSYVKGAKKDLAMIYTALHQPEKARLYQAALVTLPAAVNPAASK